MKKIINLIKNNIFGFIIGIVVASSVSVIAATLYYSNQVSYTPEDTNWNVNNVKDALDELYSGNNFLINDMQLIEYKSASGSVSSVTLSYTSDGKYKYLLCDAGHSGSISTDAEIVFESDWYSIGGAHKHKLAIIKVENGQYVTVRGWQANLYGIN